MDERTPREIMEAASRKRPSVRISDDSTAISLIFDITVQRGGHPRKGTRAAALARLDAEFRVAVGQQDRGLVVVQKLVGALRILDRKTSRSKSALMSFCSS